jgi:uncharacterized membrane protein YeaQ/YmgE (transglycosylase-associated protein family)
MLGILWMIIVGAIVGVIAKLIHPGKENFGMLATIGLGIGGSLVATLLGKVLGFYEPGESAGFIGAIIGAVILLFAYTKFAPSLKTPQA